MNDAQWLLEAFQQVAAAPAVRYESLDWLGDAPAEEVSELLRGVAEAGPLDESRQSLLQAVMMQLVQRLRQRRDWGEVELVAQLYQQLPANSSARGPLLQWLAEEGGAASLDALGQLLVEDPPAGGESVALGLSPFFRRHPGPGRADPRSLFPRLLAGLAHLPIAASILDLANYLCRQQPDLPHPAAAQRQPLADLLGQLCRRLAYIQEDHRRASEDSGGAAEIVMHSAPLAVALCDTLALIGDPESTAVLHLALGLGHRRIRTEAAWALAKLDDEQGRDALLQLAAEPVARLRALHYADELGLGDQVDPQWRQPETLAEAELCVWLAEPGQFGVPPTQLELLDQRTQHWPGYDDVVQCHLFRFTYQLADDRSLVNVGIAGPATHAFGADLSSLPVSELYAAFAGWQAEHDEISEADVGQLTAAGQLEVTRLERRLRDAGYEQVRPLRLGFFFGDRVLVAAAQREGVAGLAVADAADISWFPDPAGTPNPLGPGEAYCIYKGRRLLEAFN